MKTKNKEFLILGSFILVIFLIFYYTVNHLLPFIISFIFAYLLRPLCEKMSDNFNVSLSFASNVIYVLFITIFLAILTVLLPIIYKQLAIFIQNIPKYQKEFLLIVKSLKPKIDAISTELGNYAEDSAKEVINTGFHFMSGIINHIWEYFVATINLFTIIILVPISLYYMMNNWQSMSNFIDIIIPKHLTHNYKNFLFDLDHLIGGYIRGQFYVITILSLYYSVCFYYLNLDLPIILGVISGFLIIIPFIGTIISYIFVLINSYLIFHVGIEFIYVSVIFTIGNLVEGYILTPRIIGKKIGIMPIWIMISIFIFGSLFGFVGVLFAMPFAGISKILLKYFLGYYKNTHFYNDLQ